MSLFMTYILQFQEIIVYKIPPGGGEGVYSQPEIYYFSCGCAILDLNVCCPAISVN